MSEIHQPRIGRCLKLNISFVLLWGSLPTTLIILLLFSLRQRFKIGKHVLLHIFLTQLAYIEALNGWLSKLRVLENEYCCRDISLTPDCKIDVPQLLEKKEKKMLEMKLCEQKVDIRHLVENLEKKKGQLDMLRNKLDLEEEMHQDSIQETEKVILNGFQKRFSSVFLFHGRVLGGLF